jgi:nucleoside-diphosphate-sugar epimerase
MKVLVTGASGFLGSHIAEQLVEAGNEVRLLLRNTSSRAFLNFPHEVALGDVTEAKTLGAAVAGCDAVVHAAGLIKARNEDEFAAVNELGTANLVTAIQVVNPDVKRFVYISSLAAHGPGPPDGSPRALDAPPEPVSAYGRTKLVGELILRESFLAGRTVAFRMPVIYGPRDPALLPFFRSVRWRIAPLLAGGKNRISIVYVEDAASAVVLGVTSQRDIGGKSYCPEDGNVYTWRELLTAIEEAVGRKALMLPTPRLAYQGAALVSAGFGWVTRRAVVFTPDKVREMSQQAWVCSGEALRRDLGWVPLVQKNEGARLTYNWYQQAGWM